MAPVLRDLASLGIAQPRIEDAAWADGRQGSSVMLLAPKGFGRGLRIDCGDSEVERVVSAAAQIQEWAIEDALWPSSSTNWPPCPHHPNNHPMLAATRDQLAVWQCPTNGTTVSLTHRCKWARSSCTGVPPRSGAYGQQPFSFTASRSEQCYAKGNSGLVSDLPAGYLSTGGT
jgi:hypothetical protein